MADLVGVDPAMLELVGTESAMVAPVRADPVKTDLVELLLSRLLDPIRLLAHEKSNETSPSSYDKSMPIGID
jgi:hypothetical protein